MERKYGTYQSNFTGSEETTVDNRSGHHRHTTTRQLVLWILPLCLLLSACQSLKNAATLGAVASSVGVASAVLSPVATSALAGASVMGTALVLDSKTKPTGGDTLLCGPTNFFDIIEALITHGSYWLLLLVGVPLFIGWFTPGPTSMKSRKSK